MTSEWSKKKTRDAYLSSIPYGLRQQMGINETTIVGGGMVGIPKPMLVGTEKGTEDDEESESSVTEKYDAGTTGPAADGHTHTATIDGFGNGDTSYDDDHQHNMRSFAVAPASENDPHIHSFDRESANLPTMEPTPPYTGEM